jgi:hypothetical protein
MQESECLLHLQACEENVTAIDMPQHGSQYWCAFFVCCGDEDMCWQCLVGLYLAAATEILETRVPTHNLRLQQQYRRAVFVLPYESLSLISRLDLPGC